MGVFVACAATVHASAPALQSWLDGASDIEQWVVSKQEHLHTIPELMFDTPKTYRALEETLSELGISHRCAGCHQAGEHVLYAVLLLSDHGWPVA